MTDLGPFVAVNLSGAVVGTAVWFTGRWAARRGRWAVLGSMAAACLLLSCKSALYQFPEVEAWLFPVPWYVRLQDYWVVLLALLFLGLAIPQVPEARNRRALTLLAVAILVMGGARTQWMLWPERHGEDIFPDADHHLAQSTMHTCAPCADAIALSYLGIRVSERHMAELCLTRSTGTTIFNIYRGLMLALDDTPWRPHLQRMGVDDLMRAGRVAVIDFPGIRHALTVRGTGNGFIVHDPLDVVPQDRDRGWMASHYGGWAITLEAR